MHLPRHIVLMLPLVAVGLVACSTFKASSPAPASTAAAQPTAGPAALTHTAQIDTPATHFEKAMALLQGGDSQQAGVELHAYLAAQPDSKSAHDLLAQIETPIEKLLPSENFVVVLEKDDTLSSLAKIYLGDSLKFYELARYNGIAIPSKIRAGQSIKIPKTATALAAQHDKELAAKGSPAEETSPLAAGKPQPESSSRQMAQEEFKKGLLAFQQQDLDGAIAAWDKALAIDPTFKDAELNRAQALRLKEKLKKLKAKRA